MKVKELIKELQKFDGNLPVFLDDIMEVWNTVHVRKIKVVKEKHLEVFYLTNESGHNELVKYKRDRFRKKSINSKFPTSLLISHSPDWKKENRERKKKEVDNAAPK